MYFPLPTITVTINPPSVNHQASTNVIHASLTVHYPSAASRLRLQDQTCKVRMEGLEKRSDWAPRPGTDPSVVMSVGGPPDTGADLQNWVIFWISLSKYTAAPVFKGACWFIHLGVVISTG